MSLFQKNIEKKYLKLFDHNVLNDKYQAFLKHFADPSIQENIRNCNEEQYQGEFLIDLFVNILGYLKNPSPTFNLTTEYKNIKDAKKADGAIIINEKVKAVIELKGTDTTDLGKIESQAFGYKNNQPDCRYVIISNFEKLRFYIDNAIEHIEFNLFQLSKADFDILYLCLSYDSILKDIPKKVKEESISQEDKITRQLYSDYSLFKQVLFQNLTELNPAFEPLILYKKSQKLLDRFLFLLFAEDRQLLPPNSVRLILNDWKDLRERDVDVPLFERFKKYFEYLNTGYKGQRYDVFAYNGGLFKHDEVLDNVKIDDELLFRHTYKLSEYDFASEIDVNILGHIFENSLNEIEEVTAKLEGIETERARTKRKKDGVFYTPRYITGYIVENTVGKLCDDKKAAIGILESDFNTDKKRSIRVKQLLLDKLQEYRDWLLRMTVCDPACGSGAFLNQALDFLIKEHHYIDELQAKIFGSSIIFSDIEKSILENNLYGVDINEESVEIAKLSLWLRTARPNRTLNDLNNNIKCGNSLIDNPEVGGTKAFNWQTEFSQVFDKGGFDVVIGNPPYVQLQSMGDMSDILKNCGYQTFDKGADLYCLFTERGYNLLKEGGIQSFIMPNKWMIVSYGKPLRKYLSETGLRQILNFGDIQFFHEAATIVCIFVTQKSDLQDTVKVLSLNKRTYQGDFSLEVEANIYDELRSRFNEAEWIIQPQADRIVLDKMRLNATTLKSLPVSINYGIKTGYNEAFYIDKEKRDELVLKDPKNAEIIKPLVRGREINAYCITNSEFMLYIPWHFPLQKDRTITGSSYEAEEQLMKQYPSLYHHLLKYKSQLTSRNKAETGISYEWYALQRCAANYYQEFAKPKIIYPNMTSLFPFMYDESGMLCNDKTFIITAKDSSLSLLFLSAVLNSSMAKLWVWYNCPELLGGTREIRKVYFENFPVPNATPDEIRILEELANRRIELTQAFQETTKKFQYIIKRRFNLQDLSLKLQDWYKLEFNEFFSELVKKKVRLSLNVEAEWEEFFIQEKKKASEISSRITNTDHEIDSLVSELYGLESK